MKINFINITTIVVYLVLLLFAPANKVFNFVTLHPVLNIVLFCLSALMLIWAVLIVWWGSRSEEELSEEGYLTDFLLIQQEKIKGKSENYNLVMLGLVLILITFVTLPILSSPTWEYWTGGGVLFILGIILIWYGITPKQKTKLAQQN